MDYLIGKYIGKRIGKVIGDNVRLGAYLNALYTAYKQRVLGDSGTISDQTKTNAAYANIPQQDSVAFAWLGVAGSKKRTSGILNFFTKIYTLFGTKDATQTTEADQPYVSGDIAPNENEGLNNPNGDTRFMTHDEISFADNEAWTVTSVLNWNGKLDDSTERQSYTGAIGHYLGVQVSSLNTFRLYNGTAFDFLNATQSLIGKNSIVVVVYTGTSLSLYIDGVLFETKITSNASFDFTNILNGFTGTSAYNFEGKLPAHIIHSTALTPTEIADFATYLQTLYPEIPSVEIGTEDIASSSFEAVASSNGTAITEAADNTDWATGLARWRYFNDDSSIGSWAGKLYNKAARDVIIANPPSGNHVATEAELTALALNGGNALKKDGTDYWNTTGGTNSTGFSAVGSSSVNADGTFNTIKETATFWCADSDKVLKVYHNNDTAEVVAVTSVNEGFSIRLIKD